MKSAPADQDDLDDVDHRIEPDFRNPLAQVLAPVEPIRVGKAEFWRGDALDILDKVAPGSIDCVITSPPYNIGKAYERRVPLSEYTFWQETALEKLVSVLGDNGSLCWQVGSYVSGGEVVPIDSLAIPILRRLGMKIRNRIVWTFDHGLHCRHRLSGRHETIIWATKGDHYLFDLDAIRVPQKHPNKRHFKGPRKGELSGNPLGKNPGDTWHIGHVKHRHPEKTAHPCQFPEKLVERLVSSLTRVGDVVLDPFAGSGTTGVVCNRLSRRSILIERDPGFVEIGTRRLRDRLVEGNQVQLQQDSRSKAPRGPELPLC
jgi:adenine-specific DNA-methyltransferase